MAGDGVWRECFNWLKECGVKLPDAMHNNIDSFIHCLQDGVLLLNLINLLNSKCAPSDSSAAVDFSQSTYTNETIHLNNIDIFLSKCQTDFGLDDSDLFQPETLLTDIDQVLNTLSKLSKSKKVADLGILGFPVVTSELNNDQGNQLLRISDGIYHLDGEVIYMSILSDFQKTIRPNADSIPTEPVALGIYKILCAESRYISLLTLIEEKMMKPLSKLLTADQQNIIFYAIKEFIQIHQQMLHEMEQTAGPEKNMPKVYSVFQNWMGKLNIYQKYAANLPAALDLIAKDVELIKANNTKDRLKLTHLLHLPIHHICTYGILLKELSEKIPKTHEDYKGLEYTGKAMSDLAEHVNAVKEDSFILLTLEHVQSIICYWEPGKPHIGEFGRLFRDGFLKVSYEQKRKEKYYVFLFNRTVVFCTPKKRNVTGIGTSSRKEQQYVFKFRLVLHNNIFEERVGLTGCDEEENIPWAHSWRIMGPTGMSNITFYSKTAEERRRWIESFKHVMSRLHPSLHEDSYATTHTFQLQTFSSVVSCHVCRKELKGLLDQGYVCDKCGYAFHSQCLKSSRQCTTQEEIYSTFAALHNSDEAIHMPKPRTLSTGSTPDDKLEDQLWYEGLMSAEEAARLLRETLPGTFIVRSRNQDTPDAFSAPYAVSVKTNEGVKHVKVQCIRKTLNDQNYLVGSISNEFFLVHDVTFATINSLVDWYSNNFLSDIMPKVTKVCLETPFRLAHMTTK